MTAAILDFGLYRGLKMCNLRCLFISYPNKVKSITISLWASDSYGKYTPVYREYIALPSARWYPSSIRLVRLSNVSPCPAQVHFRLLTCSITTVTFVLPLTQMFVFLSRYVMFSILLSIFVCAAISLFFAWLESAHVSAPYVIAGSTHEL